MTRDRSSPRAITDKSRPRFPNQLLSSTGSVRARSPEALACARLHPVLDSMELFSVSAQFTPRGIVWRLNDAVEISDAWLRSAVWPSKLSALQHRPGRIEYG